MRQVKIKSSSKDDWYEGLDGKIIDLEKILIRETETDYIVKNREEELSIKKSDICELQEVELDLDESTIKFIDDESNKMGLTRDEFVSFLLTDYLTHLKEKGVII